MQIAVNKRKYMAVLLNMRANVYVENRQQLKKDLITIRNLLEFMDKPSEKMTAVEKVLAKRLTTGR